MMEEIDIIEESAADMEANDFDSAKLEPMEICNTYDEADNALTRTTKIQTGIFAIVFIASAFGIVLAFNSMSHNHRQHRQQQQGWQGVQANDSSLPQILPSALMGSVYQPNDFENEMGIAPTFWEQTNGTRTWGPCYPPVDQKIDWVAEIRKHEKDPRPRYPSKDRPIPRDVHLEGYCRPGFVIIGAGKCGTSSLYHYLTEHPRVLPANMKQIHYFRYHSEKNMKWYLGHFPTATSLLSSGALMTGEASPGYLPYPNVVEMMAERLPGPKIVVAGRDPLDRAWSSYKYNYVTPAMSALRRGRHKPAKRGNTDEYYEQFLFSFEEMMHAELAWIEQCLKPGGAAEAGARQDWYNRDWAKVEYDKREHEGLPALVDMDKYCYGGKVSKAVPRAQWAELIAEKPDKIIDIRNMHLVQSLLGRSLYTLPLEWWYALFPKDDIYFVCTEELRDETGEPMDKLGQFLGLPSFNFSDTVSGGMYNVGFNQGYDKATSWDEVKTKEEKERGESTTNSSTSEKKPSDSIPLSDDLRQQVLGFIRPYNERLFNLTGRRCNW